MDANAPSPGNASTSSLCGAGLVEVRSPSLTACGVERLGRFLLAKLRRRYTDSSMSLRSSIRVIPRSNEIEDCYILTGLLTGARRKAVTGLIHNRTSMNPESPWCAVPSYQPSLATSKFYIRRHPRQGAAEQRPKKTIYCTDTCTCNQVPLRRVPSHQSSPTHATSCIQPRNSETTIFAAYKPG